MRSFPKWLLQDRVHPGNAQKDPLDLRRRDLELLDFLKFNNEK